MTFEFISFLEFNKLCGRLALKLKKESKHQQIDYLISVQRGGAVMSKILSDLLNVPIATLTCTSYVDGSKKKSPHITQDIAANIKGKHIIILDEISDTGETLQLVSTHLKMLHPASVRTATFFIKTGTCFLPDFWLSRLDKWIVFPYEMRETLETFHSLTVVKEKDLDRLNRYIKENGLNSELLRKLSR